MMEQQLLLKAYNLTRLSSYPAGLVGSSLFTSDYLPYLFMNVLHLHYRCSNLNYCEW